MQPMLKIVSGMQQSQLTYERRGTGGTRAYGERHAPRVSSAPRRVVQDKALAPTPWLL